MSKKAPQAQSFTIRILLGTMSFDHLADNEITAQSIFSRAQMAARVAIGAEGPAIKEVILLKGKNILSSWLATPTSIKPPAARIEAFPPDERGIRHYPAFGTRLWGGNIQQPGKSKSKTAISIDAGEWE